MGWRGTATLLLLLVVVAGYLWFEEAPPKEPEPPPTLLGEPRRVDPSPAQPLLKIEPSAVVAIQIARQGTTRHTERTGGSWQGAADPRSMDDFLVNVTGLGALMEIPAEPGDLKDYGLAPPRSVLELRLRDQPAPVVVQIGDRNPATTGVYVRLDESGPVFLAGALMAWEIDKAFNALAPGDPNN